MSHLYPRVSSDLYQGINKSVMHRAVKFQQHLVQLQSTQELDQMIVCGLPDIMRGYGRQKETVEDMRGYGRQKEAVGETGYIQSVCWWSNMVFNEQYYTEQMSRLFDLKIGPESVVEHGHDMILNMFMSLPWDHSTLMHLIRNVFDITPSKGDSIRLEQAQDRDRLEYMTMAIRQDRFQGLVFAAMSESFRVTERRSPQIIGRVREELDYLVHF